MGRKYIFHNSKELYFVSFATVNWIDVFMRKIYFDIVVDSLRYCIEHKGMELYAWVIMPSHVHLIISLGNKNLSDIMRDLNRHTSKTVQESRREWLLWIACPDFFGIWQSREAKYQQ